MIKPRLISWSCPTQCRAFRHATRWSACAPPRRCGQQPLRLNGAGALCRQHTAAVASPALALPPAKYIAPRLQQSHRCAHRPPLCRRSNLKSRCFAPALTVIHCWSGRPRSILTSAELALEAGWVPALLVLLLGAVARPVAPGGISSREGGDEQYEILRGRARQRPTKWRTIWKKSNPTPRCHISTPISRGHVSMFQYEQCACPF